MQSSLKHIRWSLATAILVTSAVLIGIHVFRSDAISNIVTNVAVSASGRWIAAGTRDGRVKVCALSRDGRCRTLTKDGSELNDLQFSPDERVLAIADNNIRLVGVSAEGEPSFLRDDKLGYGTVRFDRSGSELLTINSQSQIELISLGSQAISTTICCSSFYGEVAFVGSTPNIVNAGHWPRVWTKTGELIGSLSPNREIETLRPIVVDEAGHRIFMGSQDGRVYAWSLANFKLIGKSAPQTDYVDTIALVPKLKLLAYCGFEKEVHLWKPDTSLTPDVLAAKSSSNVVALPDGVSIAFGTDSGTVQIWSLNSSPRLTSEVKAFNR